MTDQKETQAQFRGAIRIFDPKELHKKHGRLICSSTTDSDIQEGNLISQIWFQCETGNYLLLEEREHEAILNKPLPNDAEIRKIEEESAINFIANKRAINADKESYYYGFDDCLDKIARPALAEWKANYQREFSMWCEINEGLKKRIAELTAEVERLKNGQRN